MKIISKFKDYYDISLSDGIDKELVWRRETFKIEKPCVINSHFSLYQEKGEFPWLDISKKLSSGITRSLSQQMTYDNFIFKKGNKIRNADIIAGENIIVSPEALFVAVGNMVFKSINLKYSVWRKNSKSHYNELKEIGCEYFWDKEKLIEQLSLSGIDLNTKNYFSREKLHQTIDNFYNLNLSASLFQEALIQAKSPIVLFKCSSKYEIEFIANPELNGLKLTSKLDPYMAFQEISMFLGGVLVNKEEDNYKADDKVKLIAHGFDNKSFKKEKSKKR